MSLVKQWSNIIKKAQWDSIDTLSAGSTTHLYNLLLSIISVPCSNRTPQHLFFNGFHFLYNNQPNINVAADGYDNYQAPVDDTDKELFSRRLWVKGCVNFFPRSDQFNTIKCSERILNVRVMKESTFVNIERNFTTNDQSILNETRTLMYTNQPFVANNSSRALPTQVSHTLSITLSPTDLLKYSFLTYNLHKIHWDANYCQTVEKLPNVIVHGPFMVTLLLYWFNCKYPHLPIKSFAYKNLMPCFVNESLTLTMQEASPDNFAMSIVNASLGKTYLQGTLLV
mgnify:CR=1 FL=1